MGTFKAHIEGIRGDFSAQAFDFDNNEIYTFQDHNKVVLGAGRLIARMLASYTQGWNPGSYNLGITKFVLFGIDPLVTSPDCNSQMLAGDFSNYYDALNPVTLDQITTTAFPCLLSADSIEVSTVPVNSCDELTTPTTDGSSVMSSDTSNNMTQICVRIGPGYVSTGNRKYYAMAALVGRTSESSDLNEYVIALEQFPVMIKTPAVTFRFSWTVYI